MSTAPAAVRDPLVHGAVQHPREYLVRRFLNWFPLGIAYAMLYMGRYNLNVAKRELGDLMSNDDFGNIFGIGTLVYGCSFVINGPLTDRIEGRRATLIALAGAFVANVAMGVHVRSVLMSPDPKAEPFFGVLAALYAVNMYFQSFGAVSIVKVNSSWFHVRERGSFSGIFGVMISSGIYFAYDVNQRVINWAKGGLAPGEPLPVWVVFFLPAALLLTLFVVEWLLLRDHPSGAGLQDIETGSHQPDEGAAEISQKDLLLRILLHPVILTVAFIEFCTGVLRQAVMQWLPIYADENAKALRAIVKAGGRISEEALSGWAFTKDNWGAILFVAGVSGGLFAGLVSDKIFQSRRAPAAALLYALIAACTVAMVPFLDRAWALAGLGFFLSLAVIGTHGLLSGTATMDFGGKKGTATAVGVIDGFVYLGTGLQSFALGKLIGKPGPDGMSPGWHAWPWFMLPFSVIGLLLLFRIWKAIPQGKKSAAH